MQELSDSLQRTNRHTGQDPYEYLLEQRYVHFFEQSPTMLVITRHEEGIAFIADCNALFRSTLDYSRDEIIGRPLADFYCPESKAALLSDEGYHRALESGIIDVERNLVRRDGTLVPTILRALPIQDETGQATGTHAAFIDISVRKEADAARQQSEEKLRQALDAARMGTWEWDIDSQSISWSDQALSLFGRTAGESPDTYPSYINLIHPEDQGLIEKARQRALINGEYAVTHRLHRPDGTLRWLEAKGRVLYDGEAWPVRMYGTIMDVTDRRMAEEELRRSREQLSTTLENAPAYILTLDRTGTILASNRTPDLVPVNNIIGQPLEILASAPHQDRPRKAFNQVLATGLPVQYEASSSLISGVERHYEIHLGPVIVDNEITQVIFIATDITERVQAEETLRRFRIALDSSADGIFLVNAETLQILDVNLTACTVLGYTREEMLQISGEDLLPTVEREELDRQLKKIIDRDESFGVIEADAYSSDGIAIPVEIYLRAIETPEGHIIVASVRNISDRKEVEAALKQERALLTQRVEQRTAELAQQAKALRQVTELQNAILTYGGTAILSTTPDGIIRTFNPAAEALFEISATDVIGRMTPVPDSESNELSLHPLDSLVAHSIINSPFRAPASELDNEPREWTFVRENGSRVPVLLSVTALSDEAGNPIGFAGMANDISLRKQSEEALRRSEDTLRTANAELARALRLKDEFLANMSHELRTPLNAILNLTESLVEEIAGPLSDRQQSFCQLILESSQHLLSLINDILDLSKIDSGRTELDVVPVAVEPICQSSMRMVAEQTRKKRLTSSIHIDDRAKWVQADARQLKQMLVNLLGNAVKFTPRGGRIGIDVSVVPEDAKISFTVWDTGIGITSEDLQRLFQPFVQLDSGLSRQYGGTGLGLVLVARMARVHGGGVRVESAPGEGSRFTVDLHWSASASNLRTENGFPSGFFPSAFAAPRRPRVSDGQQALAPLVLLVDDTDSVVAPVVSYLEANHFKVATTYNGQGAIAQARELKPDLILMDTQMPDIDHLETTRWIRSERGLESIPIIALTALDLPGDRERCLANGFDDYLAKPVRLRNLLSCIEKHLQQALQ